MKIRIIGKNNKVVVQEIGEGCFVNKGLDVENTCLVQFNFEGCIDIERVELLLFDRIVYMGNCVPAHRHEKVIFKTGGLRLHKC